MRERISRDERTAIFRVADHVRMLIKEQKPFITAEVTAATGTDTRSLANIMIVLRRRGALTYRFVTVNGAQIRLVTIDKLGTTPLATGRVMSKLNMTDDEIMALRIARENEHAQHRRYWLEREREPRPRAQPRRIFMDKATELALQGLSA
jgi:hypothetical protein